MGSGPGRKGIGKNSDGYHPSSRAGIFKGGKKCQHQSTRSRQRSSPSLSGHPTRISSTERSQIDVLTLVRGRRIISLLCGANKQTIPRSAGSRSDVGFCTKATVLYTLRGQSGFQVPDRLTRLESIRSLSK